MNSVDALNLLLGIGPSRPQLPVTLRKSGYLPVRTLGRGSYGHALLVFHEVRKQYFVVKHLNLAGMSSRQRHEAHNEITILQKLHHPNIVRYVEYYEEHPHLYIVMEYADGGDIFTLLKSAQTARKAQRAPTKTNATAGLLTETQVVSLFVQTTMAVKYMHDRRLLHRDIKSSNIFLTKSHVVKLGDFGISTVLQSTVAMASTLCGTPCYFSPELCKGDPYNNKSDMWALGVLLYELCAGHVPFESTTMKALMRDIVYRQPPRIPAAYSDALWALILQLLQKDPRKRPDAGQVLLSSALMQYVPELIEQLAADPAYRDAISEGRTSTPEKGRCVTRSGESSRQQQSSRDASSSPYTSQQQQQYQQNGMELRGASGDPPDPPPRDQQQRRQQPVVNEKDSVTAARSPSSSSSLRGGQDQPPLGTGSPRGLEKPSGSSSPNGTGAPRAAAVAAQPTSIDALIARYDAQKALLAENKAKKQQQQEQQRQDQEAEGRSRAGHDSVRRGIEPDAKGGVYTPKLSPGAKAAMALHAHEEGPNRDLKNQGVPQGAPERQNAFVPPRLPVALRDGSKLQAREGAVDKAKSPARSHDAQQQSMRYDDRSASPPQQPATRKEEITRAHAPGDASDGTVTPPPSSDQASGELGAVLMELSSWRDRSLRRQQRGQISPAVPRSSLRACVPPPSPTSASSAQTGGKHPQQLQQRRPLESELAERLGSRVAAGAPPPPADRLVHPRHGSSSGGLPISSKAATEAAVKTPTNTTSQQQPQQRPLPSPPMDSQQGPTAVKKKPIPAVSGGQDCCQSARAAPCVCAVDGKSASTHSPTHPSPSSVAPAVTRAPQRSFSPSSVGIDEERHTDSVADVEAAQSFVDMMGTALDVSALQESAPAAGVNDPAMPHSVGLLSPHSSSTSSATAAAAAMRRLHQQSMHTSYRGTLSRSRKPAQQTVPSAALPVQDTTPLPTSLEHGAGVNKDAVEEMVLAVRAFSSSCLCGRATTCRGQLSMIYGAFVCACDVCMHFSGAASGVAWLHLPEVTCITNLIANATSEGTAAVLSPRSPYSPSSAAAAANPRQSSAGGGAAAASVLRAQANDLRAAAPPPPPLSSISPNPEGSSVQNQDGAETTSGLSASTLHALAVAEIRVYTHHQRSPPLLSTPIIPDGTANLSGLGADATTGELPEMESYTIFSCLTCGGLLAMVHDGVDGLLLPKRTVDVASLEILEACAETEDLEEEMSEW